MMSLSIRVKLILSFAAILVLFSASILINHLGNAQTNKDVKHIKEVVNQQVLHANTIKTSVIEIQQFLTDASLTKSEDSLKEAEQYRDSFKTVIGKYEALKTSLSDRLKKIDTDFDKYYSLGQSMANAYLEQGTESGNALMAQFDPASEAIIKEVGEMEKASDSAMENDLDDVSNKLAYSEIVSLAVAGFVLLCIVFIVISLGRQITLPMNKLMTILMEIENGQGDLRKRIDIRTRDEIGKTAHAFNRFMDNLEEMVGSIKKNIQVVAGGSEMLNHGVEQSDKGIVEINSHMKDVSEDTVKIGESISGITESIAEIARSAQSTASDAQDISGAAGDIDRIAQDSGKMALEAKQEMEKIEQISSETVDITETLGHEAEEIGKIIDTIKAITDQTNLLALNAAIEAARAGEQGKGFGVVAEEIRKLAESNNQSAKTIENLVKSIQGLIRKTIQSTNNAGENIKQGSRMVENVYSQLTHIIEGVGGINERIQNIAACTEEQSASTEELSATMESINGSNQQISSTVVEIASGIGNQEETMSGLSSTAKDLNQSAEQLKGLINRFKLDG